MFHGKIKLIDFMLTSQNCCLTTNIEIAINIGVKQLFPSATWKPVQTAGSKKQFKRISLDKIDDHVKISM